MGANQVCIVFRLIIFYPQNKSFFCLNDFWSEINFDSENRFLFHLENKFSSRKLIFIQKINFDRTIN